MFLTFMDNVNNHGTFRADTLGSTTFKATITGPAAVAGGTVQDFYWLAIG